MIENTDFNKIIKIIEICVKYMKMSDNNRYFLKCMLAQMRQDISENKIKGVTFLRDRSLNKDRIERTVGENMMDYYGSKENGKLLQITLNKPLFDQFIEIAELP